MEVAQQEPVTPPRADAFEPLRDRITHLEHTVDRATRDVAALRLQVATLVAASRDINKRLSSRPARPAATSARVSPYRIASAVAAVILGIIIASSVWMYSTSGGMDPIVMKAAPAASAPATTFTAPTADTPPAGTPPQSEPASPVAAPAPAPTPVSAMPVPVAVRVSSTEAPRPAVERRIDEEPRSAGERRIDYVGTLSIDSTPGGEVFINRQDAGRTPLRVEKLKAGSHLVWIEREGYRRWTRVVQVPADRVSRVVADLEPIAR